MKKYIHIDHSEPRTPSSKYSNQQPPLNSSNRYQYNYPEPQNSELVQRSNMNRTHTQAGSEEGAFTVRQQEVRPRNNTQRALNEKCRTDRVSPYRPKNISVHSQKQLQKDMYQYILKLKELKMSISRQVNELQKILDDTSRHIQSIDSEFEIVKIRIMDYTSRCLDHAFKTYKQQMPRWSKYEEVEKKSLQLILQLEDYISEQTQLWENVKRYESTFDLNSNMKEIINRTSHYTFMAKQMKKIKEECLAKHPTLHEEKVKQFEQSLAELCAF